MDIKLTLTTKNYAVIQEITLKSDSVPRIGELVSLEQDKEYFVYEVKYKLNDSNTLIPHLRCLEWLEGDRYLEMAQQGWHLLQEEE